MMRMTRSVSLSIVLCLFSPPGPAGALEVDWDRVEHIKEIARNLAERWQFTGTDKIMKENQECYENYVQNVKVYDKQVEACLVTDILHSQMSARFSNTFGSAEYFRKNPEAHPRAIMSAMLKRVIKAGTHTGLSPEELAELTKLVREHGIPVFMRHL